jgi:hypothetical protein
MTEPWTKYIELGRFLVCIGWSCSKPCGWFRTMKDKTETHIFSFCRLKNQEMFAYRLILGPLCIIVGW